MHRIHWSYRVGGIMILFTLFGILGYCTRTPKLGPTEVDDSAQKHREQLNQEIGQEAFNKLREKYGDQ